MITSAFLSYTNKGEKNHILNHDHDGFHAENHWTTLSSQDKVQDDHTFLWDLAMHVIAASVISAGHGGLH